MKRNRFLTVFVFVVALTSCNKYLDELPDNRTQLDNEDKIRKILVSAYPQTSYMLSAEFSSDNVDDYSVTNPYSERIIEVIFRWVDVTETGYDAPTEFWKACYAAIGNANEALAAIEGLGSPSSLEAYRGEALVARAYSHFLLVNLFAQHYSKDHAATDPGVTYMLAPERELNPKYERNTVEEVYSFIKADLQAGIPLINDAAYGGTPKYHMNRAAAHALAARVALYMGEWADAVRYASAAIGSNPASNMRDNATLAAFSTDLLNTSIAFTSSSQKSNLFLATSASNMGLYFGPYYLGSRFSHGSYLAGTETWFSDTPWGRFTSSLSFTPRLFVYTGTNLDKTLAPRIAYMFEYVDPVAQIGYRRAIYAPFNVEETLLVRAEANIHQKNYDAAFEDMNLWLRNNLAYPPSGFSIAAINEWANATAYYTPTAPTAKKRLNPEFVVETGTQENMLHALLLMRRLETIHGGLRWFDIKRYGIEVTRRVILPNNQGTMAVASTEEASKLQARDKRHALQLPMDVISAGLTPNRQ